jgi:SNF2 family DNA or RNA helicase
VVAGDASEEQRAIDIDAFQAGKKRFMMLTAAAGGVGITLTAASIVAVIQRPWNSDLAAQAIDRFHRIGSEKHEAVTVVDYVSENSIEQRQITRLAENAAKQEELLHDQAKLLELFS